MRHPGARLCTRAPRWFSISLRQLRGGSIVACPRVDQKLDQHSLHLVQRHVIEPPIVELGGERRSSIAVPIPAGLARRRTIAEALAWGRAVSLSRFVPRAIMRNGDPLRSSRVPQPVDIFNQITPKIVVSTPPHRHSVRSASDRPFHYLRVDLDRHPYRALDSFSSCRVAMDPYRNPFAPGAGSRPPEVGRPRCRFHYGQRGNARESLMSAIHYLNQGCTRSKLSERASFQLDR